MKKHLPKYKVLAVLNSLVFILFSVIGNQTIMTVLLLSLFIIELIYALRSIYKNILLLLFLIAFFTFLMGRLIIPLIINMSDYGSVFFSYMDFKQGTTFHVIISLYISLLFIFFSYTTFESKTSLKKLKPDFDPQSPRILFIRKWAKFFLWFTFPFALLVVFEKIRYVLAYGYFGMLLEGESKLPSIVIILSVLFEYMVYLFLATLPSKREAKIVIVLYVIFSITNIIGGDRGECMLALFVIIYYFFLRNRLYRGSKEWIGFKGVMTMILIAPFTAIVLFSIAFLRDSKTIDNDNVMVLVGGFFFQQGASVNVIACAYEDENCLPKGKWYSIGPIIDYLKINYVSRLIFGTKPYPVGSQELATKGNSLDSAITYVESPSFYERGGGMGSSFIAEAYYDCGYIGIVMYSLLYGFVLVRIPKWNSKNTWLSVIALIFLKYIMYAPRARATAFIASAASVSFWPVALIIYIASLKYSATRYATTKK